MHQDLTMKDNRDDSAHFLPSAFQQLGGPGCDSLRKRDSGYGTDYSPASNTSSSRRFTYDDPDVDFELSEAVSEMELKDDAFVGWDLSTPSNVQNDETDMTDREVEELFGEDVQHTVSQPVAIKRPSAPIPTPEDYEGEGEDAAAEDYLISVPFHHTRWSSNRNLPIKGYKFRPIVSRSIGTQTPSPHSQMIREAVSSVNTAGRFQPYQCLARGTAVRRLRFQSDSDDSSAGNLGPLPDIVPRIRDRSVSLPEVPLYRGGQQEQEVGRELRRISDEFHSSFTRVGRRRTQSEQAASFPLTATFHFTAYWNSIRQIWSSSPLGRPNDRPDTPVFPRPTRPEAQQ